MAGPSWPGDGRAMAWPEPSHGPFLGLYALSRRTPHQKTHPRKKSPILFCYVSHFCNTFNINPITNANINPVFCNIIVNTTSKLIETFNRLRNEVLKQFEGKVVFKPKKKKSKKTAEPEAPAQIEPVDQGPTAQTEVSVSN